MIKMQVRIDDNVDVLRSNSGRREIIEQQRRLPVKLSHARRELVAHPGFDQHRLLSCANEQRVEPGRDVILFVSLNLSGPHHFRHDAKKCAAIERVSPVRKTTEFKIAKRKPVHKASVPQQLHSPRICAGFPGSNALVFIFVNP